MDLVRLRSELCIASKYLRGLCLIPHLLGTICYLRVVRYISKFDIIKEYESHFYGCTPIEYKGVKIHPLKICENSLAGLSAFCLLVEQHVFNDIELMGKSRLDFLISVVSQYENIINNDIEIDNETAALYRALVLSLDAFITHGLKADNWDFCDPNNPKRKVLRVYYKDEDYSVVLNMQDFDSVKYLFLELNGISYEFEKYPIAMRHSLDEQIKKMAAFEKDEPPTLEKLIDIAYLKKTGSSYEDILNLPRRKFFNLIDNIRDEQAYVMVKSAELSGMVEIKEHISHWMSGGYVKDIYKDMIGAKDVSATSGRNYV